MTPFVKERGRNEFMVYYSADYVQDRTKLGLDNAGGEKSV
ncbi:MAG: hypothetical protein ACD_61C00251G0003 [uncultured bacterium]|nr:MAG: hypothetical protein ACD_61C00251G0003 [uncultured bacterium]